ncbi:DUF6843 domain-containing protein [Mucilaginibacter sp.]|jgi:hypothetical protein|uniref:DUF6843 domain-containing protein n=1 Tax=Mucilaginibacter sp. TaxID=1882438 RepID=UPI002C010095|nr:hypothetical protein [Mucilaginibacter sp.]HTI57517.1 hypothetical protein [Mucilaginibacter sp.]
MDAPPKREDKFYVPGVVLIALGYLISLMPYLWLFGTPLIYLTGVVLIFISKRSTRTKVLFTLLPIIFWLPGFWLFVYFASEHMTPETFLIPQNFRGKITLYYGEPCGQQLQKIDGRYIYHIPQNGIMIIKNPLETGIIDQQYYVVDSNGRKTSKLDMLVQRDFNEEYTIEKNPHKPKRNKIAVFLGGTGGSGAVNGVDEDHYKFREMYVDSWDSLRVLDDKKSDSIAFDILRNCRKEKP